MATTATTTQKTPDSLPKPKPSPEPPTLTTKLPSPHPDSSPNPVTPPAPTSAVAAAPTSLTKLITPAIVAPRPRAPSFAPDSDVIHIPSYSRWFSWNGIHECEVRNLPEFFDGKASSKNPNVYKYYRNSIVKQFRDLVKANSQSKENPAPKITYTEARKSIIGDVGSVRRVFDFLEAWGLINYHGSPMPKPQSKWEDKESKPTVAASQQGNDPGGVGASGDVAVPKRKFCSTCNTLCTIACFSSVKKDSTLCARCYVRGGVNSADYKRVEINDEVKTDWTDKETLQLLEAVMHYGDNWKKVAEHVTGRNEKECVNRFIKLPFGEQFNGPPDSAEVDENIYRTKDQLDTESSPRKKMRLNPLADASNPIMAQAAFLSALVGVEVAEAAASAAVSALCEINSESSQDVCASSIGGAGNQESSATTNDNTAINSLREAYAQARSELEEEDKDLERRITDIAEVQAKEIHDKIVRFEELELQMEKEWQQLRQMQNQLYADQLTLSFHKTAGPKRNENLEHNAKAE